MTDGESHLGIPRSAGVHSPRRMVDDTTSLRVLLETVLAMGGDYSLPTLLNQVVRGACRLTGARYGALGVLGDGYLSEFLTTGLTDDERDAIGEEPKGRGVLGVLIDDPQSIRLRHLAQHAASYGFPPNHPRMDSFLGVPIRVRGEVFGNLYLCEKQGAEEFTPEDEEFVVALSTAAGVAIENARLSEDRERMELVQERERIGRDLHDSVIQRLFATGMNLQGAASRVNDDDVARRLQRAVDEIDETIREIRTTIFALGQRPDDQGPRAELLALVESAAAQGHWRPRVAFDGPIDSAISEQLARELLSCTREALSNAVRHSGATHVDVRVAVEHGVLRLTVDDDGCGMDPEETRRSGLRNMSRRAEALGGTFEVHAEPDSGTHLDWQVPI
jgi:signal transduction histidine kinase